MQLATQSLQTAVLPIQTHPAIRIRLIPQTPVTPRHQSPRHRQTARRAARPVVQIALVQVRQIAIQIRKMNQRPRKSGRLDSSLQPSYDLYCMIAIRHNSRVSCV